MKGCDGIPGVVFDVKRFALHDGKGIRSTLFIKGCPLACPWCQNPEGMSKSPSIWKSRALCVGCKSCLKACDNGAIDPGTLNINKDRCKLCFDCLEACPTGAIKKDGYELTSCEAAELLLRDAAFFDGGGVTLSGGEVFSQPEFAKDVLRLCREKGVDTAIESCMLTSPETLKELDKYICRYIADIKYIDNTEHRRVLGAGNAAILQNIDWAIKTGKPVTIRTPLIPGYTATEQNIRGIARFLKAHGSPAYELLNFNPLCKSKYADLLKNYPVTAPPFTQKELDVFYAAAKSEGLSDLIRE